ncbi:MAG: site-2 protease family protein [Actinomycetota bacterium]|nr:site-2 protease family protein [Actinomycetota bacterium]
MTFVSIVLAALGFMVLVVLHEMGHFLAAKAVGMRVEKFSLFFPPNLVSKRRGETEYAIGAIPLGGYVKITGMNPSEELSDEVRTRAYYAQPVWKRITVIVAGPLVNLLLAFLLLFVFFAAIGAETPPERAEVGVVEKNFPAAGQLRPGDELLAVDGRRGELETLSKQISSHRCPERPPRPRCRAADPATVLVERGGQRKTLELTPIYDPQAKKTSLGFGYAPGPRETLPPGEAFTTTLDRFAFISGQTLSLPARLFDAERRKEISGVVGSYEVTRQTILANIADVVGILAIISLSLAIVNLFPFLPLDGGHIFWAVVELVRRKPVSYRLMERSSIVGFMLVIGLFVLGLTNDIGRLTGEGFQVR